MNKLRESRLYLARHGQVVGHDGFHVYGHTDVDITEVGEIQMEHLAERLRHTDIGAIYSSDLKRAVTGARIIGRHHDALLNIMPELREMYFGDWEGMVFGDIQEQYPEELEKRKKNLMNFRPPGGGESLQHFSDRVMASIKSILENQKGNDILLVAHAGVNRIIICNALGLGLEKMSSIHQTYGSLNIIDFFPDSALIRLING